MRPILQDLHYAIRQLRNNPGFAVVTILVLALGIGVSTATFTVLNAVLLRKPAFAGIDRLVTLEEPRGPEQRIWGVPLLDVRDWRAQNHSLEQIAYYEVDNARWERDSGTQTVDIVACSGNFFSTLGVQPFLGRTFSQDEERAKAKVVLLNYSQWQESFASDRNIIGHPMKLNGDFYQIIGVMPKGFAYPLGEVRELWTPMAVTAEQEQERGVLSVTAFGRLRRGVTPEQAQSELSAIQKGISLANPKDDLPDQVLVRRYWDTIVGNIRPSLLLLAAAVALIWLVACANVAGLMLTRNSVRQREIAVRRALGAGKLRLVRQLLTENLLYSMIAGALGLLFAFGVVRGLEHRLVREISVQGNASLRMDSIVLWLVLALSIVSTLLFGLLPALQASAAPMQHGLQVKSGYATGGQGRLRDGLVIGEIAVSLLLLVAAGLLLRTLSALHHVPLGFSAKNIITSGFSIPPDRYAKESVNLALYQPIVERI